MSRHFVIGGGCAVLLLLPLAGCGLVQRGAPTTSAPAGSRSAVAAQGPAGSAGPSAGTGQASATAGAATAPPGPSSDSPAIKSVTFDTPDGLQRPNMYRLEVTALRRRGPFTELDGRVTCTSAPANNYCDGEFVLSGHNSDYLNTPAGIMLIDPIGKKEYLVVRDSQGIPYTSTLNPSMTMGVAFPFYVNFPAVPEGVTSVTVRLPGGGQPQIADVALS
jgi:hypothetical protein